MSADTIGSGSRFLLVVLLLLVLGGGAFWLVRGQGTGHGALVLRGGALEIEPWNGDLTPEGADIWWRSPVSDVRLAIAKAENEGEEFVQADPVAVPHARSVHVDVRVANSRMIEDALIFKIEDSGVRISLKEGQLLKKGDVWVHSGFVKDSRHARYEIAKIEFFDRDGHSILRYQNPDLGRRLRFRVKLTS